MERKVIDNYPQYLRDINEIKVFAECHERMIQKLEKEIEEMLETIKLGLRYKRLWAEVLDWEDDYISGANARKFFKKYDVVTIDEITSMIDCVTGGKKCSVEYDSLLLCFTIKTETRLNERMRKKVRNVIPYNMEIVFEQVESL